MTDTAKPATMFEVFAFFSDNKTNDYRMAQFRTDWNALTDKDKENLKVGIGNGTFNY